jgi:SSS family solute:Na+ symporter
MSATLLTSLGFCLAVYIALLLYANRHDRKAAQGDLTEFFVSGRDLGLWTTVATLGATEIGIITVAFNAQKGFNKGFAAFHIGIAALIGAAFIGLTGFIVRPLRRTGVLTLPEYYAQRYGQDVQVFGAIVMGSAASSTWGCFSRLPHFSSSRFSARRAAK